MMGKKLCCRLSLCVNFCTLQYLNKEATTECLRVNQAIFEYSCTIKIIDKHLHIDNMPLTNQKSWTKEERKRKRHATSKTLVTLVTKSYWCSVLRTDLQLWPTPLECDCTFLSLLPFSYTQMNTTTISI